MIKHTFKNLKFRLFIKILERSKYRLNYSILSSETLGNNWVQIRPKPDTCLPPKKFFVIIVGLKMFCSIPKFHKLIPLEAMLPDNLVQLCGNKIGPSLGKFYFI